VTGSIEPSVLQVIPEQQRLQQFVVQRIIQVQWAINGTGMRVLWVQGAQVMRTTAQWRQGDMFLLHLQSHSSLVTQLAAPC